MARGVAHGPHGFDPRDRAPMGGAVPGGMMPRGRHRMGYVDHLSDDDDYSSSLDSDESSDGESCLQYSIFSINLEEIRLFSQRGDLSHRLICGLLNGHKCSEFYRRLRDRSHFCRIR